MFILSSFIVSGLMLLIHNLVYEVCQPPALDRFHSATLEYLSGISHKRLVIQTTQKCTRTTYLLICLLDLRTLLYQLRFCPFFLERQRVSRSQLLGTDASCGGTTDKLTFTSTCSSAGFLRSAPCKAVKSRPIDAVP